MGSTLNADAHPYAKYKFKGNKECRITYAKIKAQSKKKLMPLMSDETFDQFCEIRKIESIARSF